MIHSSNLREILDSEIENGWLYGLSFLYNNLGFVTCLDSFSRRYDLNVVSSHCNWPYKELCQRVA